MMRNFNRKNQRNPWSRPLLRKKKKTESFMTHCLIVTISSALFIFFRLEGRKKKKVSFYK